MFVIIPIIAGFLFLIFFCAYLYVQKYMRPKADSDIDEYYYEFEEQHPEYARYLKWSRITLGCSALCALLLFLSLILF